MSPLPTQIIGGISRKSGCRWFVKRGPSTQFGERGFRTKADADCWIQCVQPEWRVGYRFRFRGDSVDCQIVDRKGNEAKT